MNTLNTLFLTPLPGTRLWDESVANDALAANRFPEDWRYYTLMFSVARYRRFSRAEIIQEMEACDRTFYSVRKIVWHVGDSVMRRRQPLTTLVSNLSYRGNLNRSRRTGREFLRSHALA